MQRIIGTIFRMYLKLIVNTTYAYQKISKRDHFPPSRSTILEISSMTLVRFDSDTIVIYRPSHVNCDFVSSCFPIACKAQIFPSLRHDPE